MGRRAAASGARCIWRWTPPLRTSGRWSSPPAATATALSCRNCPTRSPGGEQIGTVTADGAYDTRRCHCAIVDRQAAAIIPIRKNGRPWKEDCPAACARNETLRATRHYGRAFWKRWTGYHARSRIEAKMPSPVRSNRWHSPARPQGLRRTHQRKRSRPPNRRNPHPRRPDEPLPGPRHRRDRSRRLNPPGKGEVSPQDAVLQQRLGTG